MPSGNGIVEKTAGGYLLWRGRDYLRPVRIVDFDNGWNRKQRDQYARVHNFVDDARNAGLTLTSVDVNGDGKPDLIVVSNDTDTAAAIVSVFLGNGDGTYQPRTDYTTSLDTGYVTVADVNKDGHPDLIVAGFPLSGIRVRSGG